MLTSNADNVILGLGNKALSDDVIGVKVVRYIIKNHRDLSNLCIIDAGSLNYEMATIMEQAQNLIVINAAKLGHSPGTITTFTGANIDQVLNRIGRNANEMALADMFKIARLANRVPANRALITIEPKKVSWGNRVSTCVNKAIPQLAEYALALMTQWTGTSFKQSEQSVADKPSRASTQGSNS